MTRSGILFELQSIDTLLDQHRKRLKEIAAILADNSEVITAEANFLSAETAFDNAVEKLKSAEKKVKDQRLKLKTTEAKLYGGKISNPKELKDLDESEALKRYLAILEDRQLEKMLEFDEFSQEHNLEKERLERIKEKKKTTHQKVNDERSKIESDVATLESQRHSKTIQIPPGDLIIYDQKRKKGHGLAVARINNRSCSACGATFTAALHQAARSPNTITICEACGRIIFA